MEGRIKKKKIWFSDKEKIARSTCPLNRPNSLLANYFLKTKLLIKNVLKKIYQKNLPPIIARGLYLVDSYQPLKIHPHRECRLPLFDRWELLYLFQQWWPHDGIFHILQIQADA